MPFDLNPAARRENARSLAAAIGLDEDQAATLLAADAVLTAGADGAALAAEVQAILERTLARVAPEPGATSPTVELVFGAAQRRTEAPPLWISGDATAVRIGRSPPGTAVLAPLHGAEAVVVACYACAAAIKAVVGDGLPYAPPEPLIVRFADLGVTPEMRDTEFRVEGAYLAGAGAIGNAFLWTLRHFRPAGRMHIADFDIVKDGNLNRQIFFGPEDLDEPKSERLALRAQPSFAGLELTPRDGRLQDLPERTNPRWLEELIVGVDSPRARRALQDELPKRVFDASTTNIEEVVLHLHEQPTAEACLSCFYPPTPAELEHARHVAEALGVGLAEVQAGEISSAAASKIVRRHPSLDEKNIVGESYDSLFKALCGQRMLQAAGGREALAPFAFVSVLAGALQAIEYVRWKVHGPPAYNGWRVSPWSPPLPRLRKTHPRRDDCIFCRDRHVRDYVAELWGPA